MAVYPGALVSATQLVPRTDLVNTIVANDVNAAYEEIIAIESTLGTSILYQDQTSNAWSNSSSAFTSVHNRLNNIERGLRLGVSGAPYVRTNAASTITAATGTVALAIKNVTGNTSNLFETYVTGTTNLGFKVTSAGTPYVGTNAVVVVNDTNYNTIKTDITNLQTGYNNINTSLYVRTDTSNTITAATGTVNLALKNVTGNTANLFETYVTGTTNLGFKVTSGGVPYVNADPVVVASSSDTNYQTIKTDITTNKSNITTNTSDITTIKSDITTIKSDITSLQALQNNINPLLLTGM